MTGSPAKARLPSKTAKPVKAAASAKTGASQKPEASAKTAPPGKAVVGGYAVARPVGQCAITGRDIVPGEKFMTGVREHPEGLERVDICFEKWPEADRESFLGYWQMTMRHPEEKKRVFVDDAALVELFERLGDTQDPSRLGFRFVLGLILMRKRLIQYDSSRQEGDQEVWQMKIRGRDGMLDLVNPRLGPEQVAEVSGQLGQILNEEV